MRRLFLYYRMHRRIQNQRKQLAALQKAHDEWLRVSVSLARKLRLLEQRSQGHEGRT